MGKKKFRKKRQKDPIYDKHKHGLEGLVNRYSKKPQFYIKAVEREYPNSYSPVGEIDLNIIDKYCGEWYIEYKSSNNGYRKAVDQLKRWIRYESSLPTYDGRTLHGLYYTPSTGLSRIWKYKNNQLYRK